MKKPAIFLDRDGTLIEEVNFLSRVEDLRLFPFTVDAINLLKEKGFLIIVVTNQSGIGRGIYNEAAMHSIHQQMQVELADAVDAFYFCPHLPCDGCRCRKPGLGMLESAMEDFDIDLQNSWMIGDKKIDVETGQSMGIRTAFVQTGYGRKHRSLLTQSPDVNAVHLGSAAREIAEFKVKY